MPPHQNSYPEPGLHKTMRRFNTEAKNSSFQSDAAELLLSVLRIFMPFFLYQNSESKEVPTDTLHRRKNVKP
jgi:hypothetical protein